MESYGFRFRSVWRVSVPLHDVWDHVSKVTEYPQWWPGIQRVELLAGPELPVTVGTRARYVIASPLYSLQYETEVQEFVTGKFIIARAEGDLRGTGKWTFFEQQAGVEAVFDWHVQLAPPFLKVLSHVGPARAVMHYFHNRLMDHGEKGLQSLLMTQAAKSVSSIMPS